MFRRMMVVLGLAVTCTATTAAAQTRLSGEALSPVRDAVMATGINVIEQRTMVGPAGTEDLWLYTNDSYDNTVQRLKKVFTAETALPGGWRVVAHVRMVNSGDFNFTLRNDAGESMLLQVRPDGDKAIARIEGRKRGDSRSRPQSRPAQPDAVPLPVDFTP
ncbi:MAG: hypothetical protein AMXMBFR64_06210 [Myxococcales bacterium]